MDKLKKLLSDMLYENGQPSLTRCMAVTSYLAFLAGSIYLLIKGQRWDNYETFATFTAGGGVVTQMANKLINSKYNSEPGQFPEKGGVTNAQNQSTNHPDNG